MTDIMHVYPVGDLRDHDTEHGSECWCRPTVEDADGGTLVVHRSMDGREDFETGRRKPS